MPSDCEPASLGGSPLILPCGAAAGGPLMPKAADESQRARCFFSGAFDCFGSGSFKEAAAL